jgi:hypothetical protein
MNTNRITSAALNDAVHAWQDALAARQKTKSAFDAAHSAFVAKTGTYEAMGAAYDADYHAVVALKSAHATAQSLYTAYNAQQRQTGY